MGIRDVATRGRSAAGVSAAILTVVLLTGCAGGGSAPEETATASSDSSSSRASASGESSASATSTTSPAPSGSESPLPDDWRPQEPTVLATGQKVPDDYEPATLEHPARNVPKPVMPEEAKQETEAGAQAFLNYRADAQWYSIQTGDTSLIREITSQDCEECTSQFENFNEIYASGNWAAGGFEQETIATNSFMKRKDGGYNLPVTIDSYGMIEIHKGEITTQQSPFNESDRFDTYLYYENGSWYYLTASPRGSL